MHLLNSVSDPTLGMVGGVTIVRGIVIIRKRVGSFTQFVSLGTREGGCNKLKSRRFFSKNGV